MQQHSTILFFTLVLAVATGCKQTYLPPVIANPPNYLVVEGFIENNGTDTTVFMLSRTVKLDSAVLSPESGAKVTVEGSDNSSFILKETTRGVYSALLSSLANNISYRLHITTSSGKQYASDYVALVYNPPIDSINWVRKDNAVIPGIQVYANTHDPQNNTRYFRWDYQETWEYHSAFYASSYYVPGVGIKSYYPNTIYTCWRGDHSTSILLATSEQLSQAVIYEAPLVDIPLNSQQISIRYSILVKQYPLSKDAFSWWQILSKNTEQIGSIFGVQPSTNRGNLHCLTDTSESVIGYVSGGNSRSQRIFITNAQASPWNYESDCVDIADSVNIESYLAAGYWPWEQQLSPAITHFAEPECVDCTRTGTNIKPSFW
jgi:hypothetical protein